MLTFSKKEKLLIKKLNTPAKVQDYLNALKFNFEKDGKDTLKSPAKVMREGNAHCTEGALLGAYILSCHGYKPLLMHLEVAKGDFDHVVALFQIDGLWGALSKTNHAVLRYREPVYKNVRELAMSYFHEYFLDNGQKTLRRYSVPLNLNIFEKNWYLLDGDLWGIDDELDKIKHYDVAPKRAIKNLRLADHVEISAGKIVEYKK
ncbi:MAG TPA: hypothetical protein PKZ36_02990 [Candidatus Paceibacterota bacterium]|nr:hypothetical protein [Candidatus Paceibacterota bacterium]HPT18345.1 hypothetical protein [Candidatus Paceibacterota bacterium]